jgi:peptidoglycan hydrolase-like protein with peptidoglycan-binding domain
VQTCLNSVNNAGLATDGIFGPLTQAAVINYQRVNGLVPDGIVGPITWEHLMRRCGFTPARVTVQENAPEVEMIPEFPPSEGIAWDGNPPGTPLPEELLHELPSGMPVPIFDNEKPMFTMPSHPVMPLYAEKPKQVVEPPPMPASLPECEAFERAAIPSVFDLNLNGVSLPDIDLDELLKLYLLRKMRK